MKTSWLVGITTLVAAGIIGISAALVTADSAYRDAHRAQWMAECRERCAGYAWSFSHRNGCTCGDWR